MQHYSSPVKDVWVASACLFICYRKKKKKKKRGGGCMTGKPKLKKKKCGKTKKIDDTQQRRMDLWRNTSCKWKSTWEKRTLQLEWQPADRNPVNVFASAPDRELFFIESILSRENADLQFIFALPISLLSFYSRFSTWVLQFTSFYFSSCSLLRRPLMFFPSTASVCCHRFVKSLNVCFACLWDDPESLINLIK